MSFGKVAGGLIGGLLGGSDSGGSQQVDKSPWSPAQKPLQNSLATGTALENYYQQNPFNPLQQAGYQNLFADLDNFRNVMAPQAMAFNNRMMNTNYQRKPAGTELGGAFTPINASQFLPPEQRRPQGGLGMPGRGGLTDVLNGLGGMPGLGGMGAASAQLGGGEIVNTKPMQIDPSQYYSGLPQTDGGGEVVNTKPLAVASPGLLSGGGYGMSVVAPNSQSYGLLNWQELNPFTATNSTPKTPPVDPKTVEQLIQEEMARQRAAEQASRQRNEGGG